MNKNVPLTEILLNISIGIVLGIVLGACIVIKNTKEKLNLYKEYYNIVEGFIDEYEDTLIYGEATAAQSNAREAYIDVVNCIRKNKGQGDKYAPYDKSAAERITHQFEELSE